MDGHGQVRPGVVAWLAIGALLVAAAPVAHRPRCTGTSFGQHGRVAHRYRVGRRRWYADVRLSAGGAAFAGATTRTVSSASVGRTREMFGPSVLPGAGQRPDFRRGRRGRRHVPHVRLDGQRRGPVLGATTRRVRWAMGPLSRERHRRLSSGCPPGVRAIAAGGFHTCALLEAGAVWCWGENDDGQLGDGTLTDHRTAAPVVGLPVGVVAISAGAADTCALLADGGVRCWGNNDEGALGDGTFVDKAEPRTVIGLQGAAVSIEAGSYHTCAVAATGGSSCWGWNQYGQLGDGSTTNRSTATPVSGASVGVGAIWAGNQHTCALIAGTAKCWGRNALLQLGDGTGVDHIVPAPVRGLGGTVVQLATADTHTCALMISSGVKCWGYNGVGQLGIGTSDGGRAPRWMSSTSNRSRNNWSSQSTAGRSPCGTSGLCRASTRWCTN